MAVRSKDGNEPVCVILEGASELFPCGVREMLAICPTLNINSEQLEQFMYNMVWRQIINTVYL
jgi:hypothetical protein